MHPRSRVDEVRQLFAAGNAPRQIAALTRLPERTIRHWCRGDRRSQDRPTVQCPRCTSAAFDESRYAYLLGAYLGDGHITVGRRGVQSLSIYCSDAWPGIMEEVEVAIRATLH